MSVNTVGMILAIIIIIVVFIYIIKSNSKIVYQQLATKKQTIDASKLGDTSGNTQQSTYSIWIYVKDWTVNYGEKKIIFKRSINTESPDLSVYLDNYEPKLTIQVKTNNTMNTFKINYGSYIANTEPQCSAGVTGFCIDYANNASQATCNEDATCYAYSTIPGSTGLYVKHTNMPYDDYPANLTSFINQTDITSGDNSAHYAYKSPNTYSFCTVPNIELQKWVNIIFSINTTNMDVYINGELTKSCQLDGIVNINNNTNVYISPNGGFNGWNSKFQYFPKYINPRQAKRIYGEGHGSSDDDSLKVDVSLYEGDTRRANIVI